MNEHQLTPSVVAHGVQTGTTCPPCETRDEPGQTLTPDETVVVSALDTASLIPIQASEQIDDDSQKTVASPEFDESTQWARLSGSGTPEESSSRSELIVDDIEAETLAQNLSGFNPDDDPASPTVVHHAEPTLPARSNPTVPMPELPGYRLIEELGRGGMGVVYRAIDNRTGGEVAVKTLLRMSPTSLQMFKQEFRGLADIAHPNIASLHELLSDGSTWCFTMELLNGVSFLEFILRGLDGDSDEDSRIETRLTKPRLARLQVGMRQLTIGLHSLHENGKLHRDVKPTNVMVTTEGRLVLLDFGLAGKLDDEASEGIVFGTPSYMSPEQAAGQIATPASDFYSVGVMLYEVLTGQRPFQGSSRAVMAEKQKRIPVPAHEIAPAAPRSLSDLCSRLLDRDPARRPTAAELLDKIGDDNQTASVSSIGVESKRQPVEVVGRQAEQDRLRQTWDDVRHGETRSVFVRGRSGMGKSILIEGLLTDIRKGGVAVILKGRCYAQESVPFKALDSLVDSLAVFLGSLQSSVVSMLMPDDSLPLTRLFPVLGQFQVSTKESSTSLNNADQQEVRQRALTGLRELITRISDFRPLVLYIDDLQWGDEDSAELLANLVRPPLSPRLLLIGAYRSENLESSVCLRALDEEFSKGEQQPHREDLAVEPLSEADSKKLAMMLLGRNTQASLEYADRIARESGGWPFFVWELAQHVRQDSGLNHDSLELDEVIWNRVCRLPQKTQRLLELLCVSGRPTPAALAYQALAMVSPGPGCLAQLRTASFVRVAEGKNHEQLVEAYHARIQESVVAHLSDETVRELSLSLAEVIEAALDIDETTLYTSLNTTPDTREAASDLTFEKRQWDSIFDLAGLFSAAGRADRALPYALLAAEQAQRQDALEVAEQQFRIAEQGALNASQQIRFRIADGLGDVLMMRGRYAESEDRLNTALDLASSDIGRAKTEAKLGELAFKRGDMTRAAETLEAALGHFGERIPRSLFGYAVSLMKEVFVQTLHTLWPGLFVHRRKTEPPEQERVRLRLLSRLSYVNWFARGSVPTLWSHLREVNLAERYLPSLELAQAWSEHAPAMTMIPLHTRGIRYGQKSLEIRRSQKHLWGEAQSMNFLGMSYYAAGRLHDALEAWQEAIDIFERTGDWWEANLVRYQIGLVSYRLGDLPRAIEISKEVHRSGLELGDEQASGISLHCWALASQGNIPADILQTELNRHRFDAQCTAQVLLAEALRLYFGNDLVEASDRLDEALRVIRKNALRSAYVAPVYSWRATVLRRRLAKESLSSSLRRKLLRKTTRAVWGALVVSKFYPIERPHALREAGELALLKGHRRKALKFLQKSLAVAEKSELT